MKGVDGQFLTEDYYSYSTRRMEKRLVNAITYPDAEGKNMMQKLLEQLDEYKKIQN